MCKTNGVSDYRTFATSRPTVALNLPDKWVWVMLYFLGYQSAEQNPFPQVWKDMKFVFVNYNNPSLFYYAQRTFQMLNSICSKAKTSEIIIFRQFISELPICRHYMMEDVNYYIRVIHPWCDFRCLCSVNRQQSRCHFLSTHVVGDIRSSLCIHAVFLPGLVAKIRSCKTCARVRSTRTNKNL